MNYHCVILENDSVGTTIHQATAAHLNGRYVHVSVSEAGARHLRFFDTTQEFAEWHEEYCAKLRNAAAEN